MGRTHHGPHMTSPTMATWIDIHTHLNMLETPPQEALNMALEVGVERIITIATGPQDFDEVLSLAQSLQPYVYGTLGVHPHEASSFDESVDEYLQAHLRRPEVVAVGEIGLDYYYEHSPIEIQKEVFRRQLQLSIEYGLPVEIHSRDAEKDTLDILGEFGGKVRGLIHCFTGTQFLADGALDLGLNVSLSGVVTFKKAEALREVVRSLPMDRIHVETDAPFLAPTPFRGKKNTPAYVVHTGEFVANLLGVTKEELARQTCENALKMFSKLKW